MIHKIIFSDELYHHGIQGQKWGIRRFQNEDGTYTPEGKERYGFGTMKTKTVKDGTVTAQYKHENGNEETKKLIDDVVSTRDGNHLEAFETMSSKYKKLGPKVVDAYTKSGMDAVKDLLDSELGDVSASVYIADNTVSKHGHSEIDISLEIYGNVGTYNMLWGTGTKNGKRSVKSLTKYGSFSKGVYN